MTLQQALISHLLGQYTAFSPPVISIRPHAKQSDLSYKSMAQRILFLSHYSDFTNDQKILLV